MNRLTNNEKNRDLYLLNIDRKKEQKTYEIPKNWNAPSKIISTYVYVKVHVF